MKNRKDNVINFKAYFKKVAFLSARELNVFLLMVIFLTSLSCNSDDFDTIGEAQTNQINVAPQVAYESITEIFIDNGLTEFNEALQYVDEELYTALVQKFATGIDQYTVFVPNNKAFFKLYDCLGMKTKDISETGDPGLVRDILQYHVVEGRWGLDSLAMNNKDRMLQTFYGESLTIKSDGSIESVENSSMIDLNEANKLAVNGIVHVITDVILPIKVPCIDNAND